MDKPFYFRKTLLFALKHFFLQQKHFYLLQIYFFFTQICSNSQNFAAISYLLQIKVFLRQEKCFATGKRFTHFLFCCLSVIHFGVHSLCGFLFHVIFFTELYFVLFDVYVFFWWTNSWNTFQLISKLLSDIYYDVLSSVREGYFDHPS
jgi:hypothetical protein